MALSVYMLASLPPCGQASLTYSAFVVSVAQVAPPHLLPQLFKVLPGVLVLKAAPRLHCQLVGGAVVPVASNTEALFTTRPLQQCVQSGHMQPILPPCTRPWQSNLTQSYSFPQPLRVSHNLVTPRSEICTRPWQHTPTCCHRTCQLPYTTLAICHSRLQPRAI